MLRQIRNKRDMWIFVGSISAMATIASEIVVLSIYFLFGEAAFQFKYAVLSTAITPIVISVPICYAIARMSLNLSEAQQRLKYLAETDALTGLPNRRAFFSHANQALAQAQADQRSSALLMIDADHFKELNDSFGHMVGDQALESIAQVLRDSFRESDLISRVGGEEFAVLLPGLTLNEAKPLAERVLKKVLNRPICTDNVVVEVSVSCGIADTSASYKLRELFKAADDAMYAAKQNGRNRVELQAVA